MRIQSSLLALSVLLLVFARRPSREAIAHDPPLTRDIKVISSAGARALADACTAWAEKNKLVVAMAIIDWGGNLIESHAMEGAPANAIDTALLKARSALRWRRPTSETNKMVRSGENLAPTFMNDFPQPGALPIVLNGQVIGAMGVSSGDGETMRAGGDRRGVQGSGQDRRAVSGAGHESLSDRRRHGRVERTGRGSVVEPAHAGNSAHTRRQAESGRAGAAHA